MVRMLGLLGVGGILAVALAGACSGEETESKPPGPTTSVTTSTSTTTTGGGGATTTTTSSSGGGGGGAVLTCDADFTNIEGECDLLAQDCPDGQACRIGGLGVKTSSCMAPQSGLKTVGAICSAASECSGALNCIDAHCTPVCCPTTDQPCAGGRCDIHVNYGGDMWAMACSYSLTCEVFEHQCPTGEDCHISNFQTGLAVCDEPSDTYVAEGEPCIYRNDCGDAQVCNRNTPDVDADAGVVGRCRYLCSLANADGTPVGDGGCPALQSCHSLNIAAAPDLGKCW